jgi:hypothetical protein
MLMKKSHAAAFTGMDEQNGVQAKICECKAIIHFLFYFLKSHIPRVISLLKDENALK